MGMEAARRGDKTAAQVLLREVVAADPDNELAWLWLASAVDNLEERRAHLEKVLSINPNNSRAEEALRRLPDRGSTPSRQAAPRRRSAAANQRSGQGPGPLTIVVAIVVGLAVLVALIFALVASQQQSPNPTNNELVAVLSPSRTSSPNPDTFTSTPTQNIIIVTSNVVLPPSYTPSATPTDVPTPTPSATPIPPSAFAMIFTDLPAGAASPDLYFSAGDGSAPQMLGSDVSDIAYDPSGEKVAFVRAVTATPDAAAGDSEVAPQSGPYYELFIAPVDNLAAATQITRFNGVISSPSWAPNGFQLAFVSNYGGEDEDIWTITDDGLNFKRLTENDGIDRDPVWSPDGSRIIFVSDQSSPGLTKLYSMAPDGQEQQLLLDMGGNTFQPAFSPDGSKLAFVNDASGDGDIFIADADGQASLLLTAGDGLAEDRSPAFTPDGRWVGFASNRGGDSFNLYATDLMGSTVVQLTDSPEDQQELDFRPDLFLLLQTSG